MAVKSIQMYRRQLDGTETDLNPLTESQYVLMENGQTVQEVLSDRDSDKYTPVITNSSSTFKVGQGDNVDLSSSMKEGAYDSCVLKGKTMVNCIQEPSSKDVVLPYEFADGRYVTINDTKESGALGVELKGQTLVNLVKKLNNDNVGYGNEAWKIQGSGQVAYSYDVNKGIILSNTVQGSMVLDYMNLSSFKPNTEYTLFVDVNWNGVGVAPHLTVISTREIRLNNGFNIIKFTSVPDLTVQYMCLRLGYAGTVTVGCEYTFNNIMVLEGDWTNVDIPYFEGMTSCKMPILKSVGKNLCKYRNNWTYGGLTFTNTENGVTVNGTATVYVDYYVIDDRDINLEIRNQLNSLPVGTRLILSNNLGKNSYISYTLNGEVRYADNVTIQNNMEIKGAFVRFQEGDICNNLNLTIQLEVGNEATTYEPHKSSILSLPEEVVLRSLPNGVRDTFNTRTGVYTQRIGEVFLNGSESWAYNPAATDKTLGLSGFSLSVTTTPDRKWYGTALCDKMPIITSLDKVGVYNGQGLNILIKSDSTNANTLKEILAKDPITVQYQLENPIVTKINLSSTLKSWNTTTHIYSEIPENTLYPTLTHSNPSYPVILKPSTKYSIVANSYSNSHTNSAINFNLGGATASTTVGNRVTTITTPSTLSNELLTMSGRGNKLNHVMVIEGDVAGDEPYFEGICDCKSPILLNCGENLFDKTKVKREKYQNYNVENGIFFISSNSNYKVTDYIRVKPNTSYTSRNLGDGAYYTFNKKPITDIFCRAGNFTVPSNAHYVVLNMSIGQDEDAVRLQEVPSSSLHESYKSNTTTFDQKDGKTIVLRSLPNGVCDTLNVETGEYVQRIGECRLDGSQTVKSWWSTTSTVGVLVQITTMKNISNLVCDRLPAMYYRDINNNTYDAEGIASWDVGNSVNFRILKSKLETEDINGVKKYLAINPVTVQYELEVPIVKTVDLSGFPFSYENGHVILSSGSIEQSLTPKVEYSLSANKTGQIDSNTRQVVRQQKQLDDFEAMMLTSLVESAYDKAILQFDYEMQMMSLGGE